MKTILILFLLGLSSQLIQGMPHQHCDDNTMCSSTWFCDHGHCKPRALFNETTSTPILRTHGAESHRAPQKQLHSFLNEDGKDYSSLHSDPVKHFVGEPRRLQACSTGADCGSQSVCVDGKCVVDNGYGGKCSVGAHCPNGYNCVNAKCVKSSKFNEKKKMSCPIRCPDGMACQNGVCLPIG